VNLVCRKPLGNPNPQKSNLSLAIALIAFVILQVAFNAWHEFTTSRTMASLRGLSVVPDDVVVVRDGVEKTLPATSLVPGDIVPIVADQKVPADVKLIEVHDGLRFDRSMLTGEVCVKTRLRVHDLNHIFPPLSRSRVNRSLDTCKSQVTTSSR
jgi:sodium/potassium-transporting ATPase subunit alpha